MWHRTWQHISRKATAEELARKAHTITYVEDPSKGTLASDVWSDILLYQAPPSERMHYDTQKPEALLRRVVAVGSVEGDLVLDCFVGSGTTAGVAEKLNRRWIACDLGRFAIHTTRKRLLGIPGVKPFVVQNLGRYERQAWQVAEFGVRELAAAFESGSKLPHSKEAAYRKFILELYHATPGFFALVRMTRAAS